MPTKEEILFSPIFILLTLISGCFSLGGDGRISDEMEQLFWENKKDINTFAEYFLEQDEIKNIIIDTKNDMDCKIVNDWGICPREESRWGSYTGKFDKGIQEEIYLDSFEDVLTEESINRETYDKIYSFMEKYDFTGIGRDENRIFLSIGDDSSNLRYYVDKNNEFKEDDEYIYVKKLDDHWYVFVTDWN